jgi:hypothetical protein
VRGRDSAPPQSEPQRGVVKVRGRQVGRFRRRHTMVDGEQDGPGLRQRDRSHTIRIGPETRKLILLHRREAVAALDLGAGQRLAAEQHPHAQRLARPRRRGIGQGHELELVAEHVFQGAPAPVTDLANLADHRLSIAFGAMRLLALR